MQVTKMMFTSSIKFMEWTPTIVGSLLTSCAKEKFLDVGRSIHANFLRYDWWWNRDIYVQNHLLNLYAKCEKLKWAHHLFDRMPLRNTVTWTILVSGYDQCGKTDKALEIFSRMVAQDFTSPPNEFTYACAISSCVKQEHLGHGMQVIDSMESNFESQSPDNADREPSFRKSLNDKGNRKYRRHSSVSGSASPSSDGSRKHERSPSPTFPRDDPTRISDVHQRRKNGGRDSDMESGRSRYDKGGDSHRHSDRWSHKSSRDHHKHGDSSRYHKRVDEGERSCHRSSGYSRESRDGTRSDRVRQGSEYDKSGDYRQNVAKYTKEKYDSQEYKVKDREESKKHSDKDSTVVRAASSRRHVSSYGDDYNRGGRDKHNKDGGGQDDMKNYGKSLGDHRSDNTYSAEEETRYDRHSNAGKETGGSRLKETQKSNIKDLDRGKGDAIEKRKNKDRESDRHEERFSKAADGRDYNTSSNRRSCVENEQYQDNPTRINEDKESSPKKFKFVEASKGKNNEKDGQILSKLPVAEDERLHSRSNLPHETTSKMMPEPAQPSNKAEVSHDLNAAKVAALKAAELVNRNLTGGGYMSTDQKKKLLWGSKKSTAVEESGHRWDVPLFSDRERQEKFKKLMGVKGDLKPEHKADNKDGGGLLQAEKQEQLQMDLEKQYTAGLRRRDGRTVGLGL